MNKGLTAVFCAVSFALAFFFLAAGSYDDARGNDFFRGLTMTVPAGMEGTQVKSMLKEQEQGDAFAAWTELPGEAVYAAAGAAPVFTEVTAVCGPTGCVLPFGKNLPADDREGCILGRRLAERLFGGYRVEGQRIVWRGQERVVRGIVEIPADLALLQTYGSEQEITYDRISLLLPPGSSRSRAEEKFVSQNGIEAEAVRWDYLHGWDWIREMIPGQWSDFAGWKKNLETYREERALVSDIEKSCIESAGLQYWERGRLFFGLGIFFTWAALVYTFWQVTRKFSIHAARGTICATEVTDSKRFSDK